MFQTVETRASAAMVLVRLLAGGVLLAEGSQKFSFRSQLGVGRFLKIGVPAAHLMAPLDRALSPSSAHGGGLVGATISQRVLQTGGR